MNGSGVVRGLSVIALLAACSCPEDGSVNLAGVSEFEDVQVSPDSLINPDLDLPGEGCESDADCPDGTICLLLKSGQSYCAEYCNYLLQECEEGWACVPAGDGLGFVCAPDGENDPPLACIECAEDADCAGGIGCTEHPVHGRVCATQCELAGDCSDVEICDALPDDESGNAQPQHCFPTDESCGCHNAFQAGAIQDCPFEVRLETDDPEVIEIKICPGIQRCLGTDGWGICDEIKPGFEDCPLGCDQEEICNGVDDDCDGLVDEDIPHFEECNGLDDDCDGEIDEDVPHFELCNGLDDDCDGEIDEDVPDFELCNGLDDDCDGQIDEGLENTVEQCNGQDDDCDGETDEGVENELCYEESPFGVCPGIRTCFFGDWLCGAEKPTAEICNGIDDNCDTFADTGDTFFESEEFDGNLDEWDVLVGSAPVLAGGKLRLPVPAGGDSLIASKAGLFDFGTMSVQLKAPADGGAFLAFHIEGSDGGWLGWGVYLGEYVLVRRASGKSEVEILSNGGPAPDATVAMTVITNATTMTLQAEGVALKNHADNLAGGRVGLWSIGGEGVFDAFKLIDACGCQSTCPFAECGDGGCGFSCGQCGDGFICELGQCVCVAQCDGKVCGPDGCGGKCGECGPGSTCINNGLECKCQFECGDKVCGGDGCGGSCGICDIGFECDGFGQCLCQPECDGKVCGDDGCGGSCGGCADDESCTDEGQCVGCIPDCDGKQCGDDGCDGICGLCGPTQICSSEQVCGCAWAEDPEPGTQTYGDAAWGDGEIVITYDPTGESNVKEFVSLHSGDPQSYVRLRLQVVGSTLELAWVPIENGGQGGPFGVVTGTIATNQPFELRVRASGNAYTATVNGTLGTSLFHQGWIGTFELTAGPWTNLAVNQVGCACGGPCNAEPCPFGCSNPECQGGGCGCNLAQSTFASGDLSAFSGQGAADLAGNKLVLAGNVRYGQSTWTDVAVKTIYIPPTDTFTAGIDVRVQGNTFLRYQVARDDLGQAKASWLSVNGASATTLSETTLPSVSGPQELAVRVIGNAAVGTVDGLNPLAIVFSGHTSGQVGLIHDGFEGGFDHLDIDSAACSCGDCSTTEGCDDGCGACETHQTTLANVDGWAPHGGVIAVDNGEAVVAGTVVTGSTEWTNTAVEATFDSNGAATWEIGLIARAQDADNMLRFRASRTADGLDLWFERKVAGTWSGPLGQVSHEAVADGPVTLQLSVSGTSALGRLGSAFAAYHGPGTTPGIGRAGLYAEGGDGRWTDFVVRDIPCSCDDACQGAGCAAGCGAPGCDAGERWLESASGLAISDGGLTRVAGLVTAGESDWSDVQVTGVYLQDGSDDWSVAIPVRVSGGSMLRYRIWRLNGVKSTWEIVTGGTVVAKSTVIHSFAADAAVPFTVRVQGGAAIAIVGDKVKTMTFDGFETGPSGLWGETGAGAFTGISISPLPCGCGELCASAGCADACPSQGPVDCTPANFTFDQPLDGWMSAGGTAALLAGALYPSGMVVTGPLDLDEVDVQTTYVPAGGAYHAGVVVRYTDKDNWLRLELSNTNNQGLELSWTQKSAGFEKTVGKTTTPGLGKNVTLNIRVRASGSGALAVVNGFANVTRFTGTATGRVGVASFTNEGGFADFVVRKMPCDCQDPCAGTGCPEACVDPACESCGCTTIDADPIGADLGGWEPVEGTALLDGGKVYAAGLVTVGSIAQSSSEVRLTLSPGDAQAFEAGLVLRVGTAQNYGMLVLAEEAGQLVSWWRFNVGGLLTAKVDERTHGPIGAQIPVVLRIQGQSAIAILNGQWATQAQIPSVLNQGRVGVLGISGAASFSGIEVDAIPCGCSQPCEQAAGCACDEFLCTGGEVACGCTLMEDSVYGEEIGSWQSLGGTGAQMGTGVAPAGALVIGDPTWTDVEIEADLQPVLAGDWSAGVIVRAADADHQVRLVLTPDGGKVRTHWEVISAGVSSGPLGSKKTSADVGAKIEIKLRAQGSALDAWINDEATTGHTAASPAAGRAGILGLAGGPVFSKFMVFEPCCKEGCP